MIAVFDGAMLIGCFKTIAKEAEPVPII